jgi:hypothetical protein
MPRGCLGFRAANHIVYWSCLSQCLGAVNWPGQYLDRVHQRTKAATPSWQGFPQPGSYPWALGPHRAVTCGKSLDFLGKKN